MLISLVLFGFISASPADGVLQTWTLSKEEGCHLVRPAQVEGKVFEISVSEGLLTDEVTLSVKNPDAVGSGFNAGEDAAVWLDPSRERVNGHWYASGSETGTTVSVVVPRTAVSRLTQASIVSLVIKKSEIANVPMAGFWSVLPQMDDCRASLLKSYGLDPAEDAAFAQGASPPKPVGGALAPLPFKFTDYPSDAIRRGQQGRVTMVLTIDPRGRVGECRVVGSSKSPSLDTTSCDIMKRRGRFRPGTPAGPGHVVTVVNWTLPKR